MAQQQALALALQRGVGGVVAAAGLFGRIGHLQRAFEQLLDGLGGSLACGAVQAGRVVLGQQSLALRLLAQQLGAGALAQQLGGQLLAGRVQGKAIDARDGAVHNRGGSAAAAAFVGSAGGGGHGVLRFCFLPPQGEV